MKFSAVVLTAGLAIAPNVFAAPELDMKANIPFSFEVGGRTLPPGMYEFSFDALADTVLVSGGVSGTSAMALVMTRLAAIPHPADEDHPHIVFDMVGDKYILSELWHPYDEGILVHATKGKHEHQIIHVTQ
jgi:hypothetical protein